MNRKISSMAAAQTAGSRARSLPMGRAPTTWGDFMQVGIAHANAGRPAEAADIFERASGLRPGDPRTRLHLGAAHLRAGAPAHALTAFNAVLDRIPEHTDALHGRALALHALGEVEAGLGVFRRVVESCPSAWKAWQSIADITPDETERIHALGRAASVLEQLCLRSGAPGALFGQCTDALLDARLSGAAIRLVRDNRTRFTNPAIAENALARAHNQAGRFRRAFHHKARALVLTGLGDCPRPGTAKAFDPGAATRVLQDLLGLLSGQGFTAFLAAGTLLGFHRSGGPLKHDRDIDIGILCTRQRFLAVASVLRAHPGVLLARAARPGDRYFAVMSGRIAADIFLYEARDDALICGFGNRPGDIQWKFSPFKVASRSYQGLQWPVPGDPGLYLAETYGPGWQQPDTGFASAVSSPALHGADDYARAYYAAARAMHALLAGDRDKARALCLQSPIAVGLPASSGASSHKRPDTEDPAPA